MVGQCPSACCFEDERETEAAGPRESTAPPSLRTGLLAETWLDPLNLRSRAQGWSDVLGCEHVQAVNDTGRTRERLGVPESAKRTIFASSNRVKGGGDRPGETRTGLIDQGRIDTNARKRTPVPSDANTPLPRSSSRLRVSLATLLRASKAIRLSVRPSNARKASAARSPAFLYGTHQRWVAVLMVLASVTLGLYLTLAPGVWPTLLFGLGGTGLCVYCGLLPVRKRLLRIRCCAHWRILRSSLWEKGHAYLGLLSCLVLHCHARFCAGGLLTSMLMVVLWAIIGSGLAALLFRHLLVLTKAAKEGKGLRAARIIATGHFLAQQMHNPLTWTLFVLGAAHAVMALFY